MAIEVETRQLQVARYRWVSGFVFRTVNPVFDRIDASETRAIIEISEVVVDKITKTVIRPPRVIAQKEYSTDNLDDETQFLLNTLRRIEQNMDLNVLPGTEEAAVVESQPMVARSRSRF